MAEKFPAIADEDPLDPLGNSVQAKSWFLYLLRCRGGVFYAGITTDVEARFAAHKAGAGARFTRANPPIEILAVAEFPDRSSASKAEWALKQQPKGSKLAFIEAMRRQENGCDQGAALQVVEVDQDGKEDQVDEDLSCSYRPG